MKKNECDQLQVLIYGGIRFVNQHNKKYYDIREQKTLNEEDIFFLLMEDLKKIIKVQRKTIKELKRWLNNGE